MLQSDGSIIHVGIVQLVRYRRGNGAWLSNEHTIRYTDLLVFVKGKRAGHYAGDPDAARSTERESNPHHNVIYRDGV